MTDDSNGDGAGDDAAGGVVERVSPDEAFERLSDETRVAIVRALYEADDPLAFSALRDAVGTRDSGRFNYHLEKLRGTYVRKTDDGYVLSGAGEHVVGAILAGQYTKTLDGDRVDVDATCTSCGGTLAGFFEGSQVRITCRDCDRTVLELSVPPGALDAHPRESWPRVAERWTRHEFAALTDGFCMTCHGPTTGRLDVGDTSLPADFDAVVTYTCERCGASWFGNAEISVLAHPALVAFYHEHDRDVTATPLWDLDWAVEPRAAVVSESPPRVEIPVELDGDRLVFTVDETAAVVDTRRT